MPGNATTLFRRTASDTPTASTSTSRIHGDDRSGTTASAGCEPRGRIELGPDALDAAPAVERGRVLVARTGEHRVAAVLARMRCERFADGRRRRRAVARE